MTTPASALEGLRNEIWSTMRETPKELTWNDVISITLDTILRRIPTLAEQLEGTYISVPREPTEAMLLAGREEVLPFLAEDRTFPLKPLAFQWSIPRSVWRAMLAAAQPESRS